MLHTPGSNLTILSTSGTGCICCTILKAVCKIAVSGKQYWVGLAGIDEVLDESLDSWSPKCGEGGEDVGRLIIIFTYNRKERGGGVR